ncbi:MAG: hypothetical protein HY455_02365 [Parcubacteria group bacterium]|nr:hypothetical protein [Parcubacteria group bacterium]
MTHGIEVHAGCDGSGELDIADDMVALPQAPAYSIHEESLIKNIIEVLLGRKALQKETETERLSRVVASEAAGQALVRVGRSGTVSFGPNYAAVRAILTNFPVSQDVVDFTINQCLMAWNESKGRNFDVLGEVSGFLPFGASLHIVERVVLAFAKVGFSGRVEATAKQYLGRGLSEVEVLALVDAYCNDQASLSGSQQDDLKELARKYLPADGATEVAKRLDKFEKEFWERD